MRPHICSFLQMVVLPGVCFLGIFVPLQAQTTEAANGPTVFKVNARTVVVNVVVTDKNGKPVQGLRKEAFQALEDGHAQQITSFEEHPGPQTAPTNFPALPPNVFTNIPRVKTADAVTVLLLDDLNTPFEDQPHVRSQMLKYLKDPVPGQRMAIFTLGSQLRMVQSFTDDPKVLATVLDNLKRGAGPQTSPLLDSKSQTESNGTAVEIALGGSPAPTASDTARSQALQHFLSEQTTSQTDQRVAMTLTAFQQLAGDLAGIPGRKNLVWFSGAFPLELFPGPDELVGQPEGPTAGQRDYNEQIQKTDALLAQAQVAVYPLDAVGVAAPIQESAENAKRNLQESNYRDLMLRVDYVAMEAIAQDTGGKAYYNNGLKDALAQIANNSSYYYTLSYTPANVKNDGRFRKIQVKLAGGYKLEYRRGYYSADAKTEKAAAAKAYADPLHPYMGPGMPDSTQISIALRVQPTPAQAANVALQTGKSAVAGDNAKLSGALTRYAVDFVIAARGLKLDPAPNGGRNGRIEATLLVYDQDGKALNWLVRQVNLDMDAARYAQVKENGVNFRLEIDAPKDAASIRSGVFDYGSNLAGTLEVPLASVVKSAQTAASKSQ